MDHNVVLLLISLFGLSICVCGVLFLAGFFSRSNEADEEEKNSKEQQEEQVPVKNNRAARRAAGLSSLRKRRGKNKQQEEEHEQMIEENEEEEQMQNEAADDSDNDTEDIHMSKKDLRKEMKRRDKEERKKFEESRREEQKRNADAKEEAYRKKIEERELREKEEEEELERLEEEKKKKAEEEFDQWKNLFSVEQEGSKIEEAEEESQGMLQNFVDYIKSNKVVVLEDLAAEFGLHTQDAINRVEKLQEMNRISGIIDDRGKFIYITEEEMQRVADFINRRGRVGIDELSRESNRLIQLKKNTFATDEVKEKPNLDEEQLEDNFSVILNEAGRER